jgi:hypothetical protein
MNLDSIKKRLVVIEAKLPMLGAGRQYPIARGSGMFGLRTAIQAAREARGNAPRVEQVGMSPSPFRALREAMLKEQAWRAEKGPDIYRDTEAIYDEEDDKCALATKPNPTASNE